MSIKSFNNNEEFIDGLYKNQQSAENYMKSVGNKSRFEFGEYFIVFTDYGFVVFGYVITEEEFNKMDLDEQDTVMNGFTNTGYVMTKSFSAGCIEGELGDQHLSQMVKISKDEFERCKELNFMPSQINLLKGELEFLKNFKPPKSCLIKIATLNRKESHE